jgi:DNA-directed RNA polymerase II subunit RPB2
MKQNPISLPVSAFENWPLFKMPIMLHSHYCLLNNKPKEFLREAGECPYDNGGYFIIDGSEKVLITRQEQAFNTLYITPQNDPMVEIYASIQCLSSVTRQVKRISFSLMRYADIKNIQGDIKTRYSTIRVVLPFVRKPIPLFVLFRALGYQSDEEIIKLIFPDLDNSEAILLSDKLHPSIIDARPFLDTHTAINYIKTHLNVKNKYIY